MGLSRLLVLIMGVTFSLTTFAQRRMPELETERVSGRFVVGLSETQSINLNHSRYIRNIVVQAEGVYHDSMIEVMVNGEVKGTIYAPGRDPSYVVTIGETTSSIQFRHKSGDRMRILSVVATMSTWSGRVPRGGGISSMDGEVKHLAQRTLMALDAIRRYATLEEEQTYLIPIRKKAGQVLIMSTGRGDLSRKTANALEVLQSQIEFSKDYIHLLMEQDGLFEEAVELLSISERIDDLLN
jgi:hypothetical protein